jgi:hypothetical protein
MAYRVLLGSTFFASAVAQQYPLFADHRSASLVGQQTLTPELKEWIGDLVRDSNISGYSVAVVRPRSGAPADYGTWGNRTEDGEAMTPDVSPWSDRPGILANSMLNAICVDFDHSGIRL